MPISTDILPDHFSGTYHLHVNPETRLVPTGYDKEAFTALKSGLERIETVVTFDRTEDADGAKLLIKLAFEDGKSINGFYYYDKNYELEQSATGIEIICRSVIEVSAVLPSQPQDEAPDNAQLLVPLADREFFFVDSVGRPKGVESWLVLIAGGSQILAHKAFLASQIPVLPTPAQL